MTGVGDNDVVEMPIYWFDPGKYVVINTKEPDGCTTLTLDECRSQSDFIGEIPLFVP